MKITDAHYKKEPAYYRSIFLSDFHMGAKSCNARAILNFLRNNESEYLYLVGDIIDGWKMRKRWYWTNEYSQIIDELAKKVAQGTSLIYVPGNHDEKVRLISAFRRVRFARRMRIQIKSRAIHDTVNGERFLVMHGDQFDKQILKGQISRFFDRIYEALSHLIESKTSPNVSINGKIKRFSLAKALKSGGKIALYLLNNFETALYKEARRSNVDGIICGHTHLATIKSIKGVVYANCGAWLKQSHNAVVETLDGQIELIDCPTEDNAQNQYNLFEMNDYTVQLIPSAYRYRPITNRILKSVIKIWHPQARYKAQIKNWLPIFVETRKNSGSDTLNFHHFITHKAAGKNRSHSIKRQQYLTFTPDSTSAI